MKISQFCIPMLSIIVLSACTTQKGSAPPPAFYMADIAGHGLADQYVDVASLQNIEPAAGIPMPEDYKGQSSMASYRSYEPYTSRASLDNGVQSNCGASARFDQQALLAYQWGRNRLGVNVDKVKADYVNAEELKISYRMKLQDLKVNVEKCRSNASWQGLLGSSYSELYLR